MAAVVTFNPLALRRSVMLGGKTERLGPNLILPWDTTNYTIAESNGTAVVDGNGDLVLTATGTTAYKLYVIGGGKEIQYKSIVGKRFRVIVPVKTISINAGDIGMTGAPNFSRYKVKPTTSTVRTIWFSPTNGYPQTPGVFTYDFVCDESQASGHGTTSFSVNDYLSIGYFLNATAGATVTLGPVEVREIL